MKISFEKDILLITVGGKAHRMPLRTLSPRLLRANERERNTYVISPSGLGIHWPLIDEDISLNHVISANIYPKRKMKVFSVAKAIAKKSVKNISSRRRPVKA